MDFSALEGHQDMLPAGTADIARLRADAAQLLMQIDEREQLHTEKVVPIPAGMWNALFRLEPAGVVVKLSANNNDFEVNFLREAAALHVPVPQVFGAGALEHTVLPDACYFLMSYEANCANAWPLVHSVMTPEDVQQLGHDLGEALARLHTVHLGYVSRFSTKVENWKQVMIDCFSPDWDTIAPNALFDDELLPIFRRILDESGYFAFHDGTLAHGDLNLSNVLLDANSFRLRAIIDPGSYAGMPMFDLAYAAIPWDHGHAFSEAMVNSYQQHGGKFDPLMFYISILVVAYRFQRFHTPAVRVDIFRDVLPRIGDSH